MRSGPPRDDDATAAAPLALAASYQREVAASLARVWENVLDWEHLPWLHRSSFAAVELLERGTRGWRVRLLARPGDAARAQVIELVVDHPRHRYRVVTCDGPGRGSEIRVQLVPRAAHATGVMVEFHVPTLPPDKLARVGERYVELYRLLWDEDEAMMIARERALTRRRTSGARRALASGASPPSPVDLGTLDDVRRRLPLLVDVDGETFRLVELDGALVAHAATCPHWLGTLVQAPVHDGCVTCPWHGYRFDVRTGAATDGRGLRLAPAPRIVIEAGRVVLHACAHLRPPHG